MKPILKCYTIAMVVPTVNYTLVTPTNFYAVSSLITISNINLPVFYTNQTLISYLTTYIPISSNANGHDSVGVFYNKNTLPTIANYSSFNINTTTETQPFLEWSDKTRSNAILLHKKVVFQKSINPSTSTSVVTSQTINLENAANFLFFSNNGVVANTNVSQLLENVEINNGVLSNFANVNGNVFYKEVTIATASTGLISACNQSNVTTPNIVTSTAVGNDQKLSLGVCMALSVGALNQFITLDTNFVFFFQIQRSFTTSFLSSVYLSNSTKFGNVFLKDEAAINKVEGTIRKSKILTTNISICRNFLAYLSNELITLKTTTLQKLQI